MKKHILNLGAGVQSTALYLMAIDGEVQKFDYAIFADTQDEPADVYKHQGAVVHSPPVCAACTGRPSD